MHTANIAVLQRAGTERVAHDVPCIRCGGLNKTGKPRHSLGNYSFDEILVVSKNISIGLITNTLSRLSVKRSCGTQRNKRAGADTQYLLCHPMRGAPLFTVTFRPLG